MRDPVLILFGFKRKEPLLAAGSRLPGPLPEGSGSLRRQLTRRAAIWRVAGYLGFGAESVTSASLVVALTSRANQCRPVLSKWW